MESADRLKAHVGLIEASPGTGPLIVLATQDAGVQPSLLSAAIEDFMAALSGFNRDLNGAVPSSRIGGPKAVPVAVAFSVAEAVRMLRESAQSGAEIRRVAVEPCGRSRPLGMGFCPETSTIWTSMLRSNDSAAIKGARLGL